MTRNTVRRVEVAAPVLDVQGSRYRILFFITRDNIVLVDDDDFSKRIVNRINRRKTSQYKTKEIFLFDFIAEFINRDLEMLVQFEKKLMQLEENENRYFSKKHLKYFGTISDRAERLMNKTSHLLEYAG